MKKIAIAALFVLGVVEMLLPFDMAMTFYAYSPQTSRVFGTPEQQQLYQQLHSSVFARSQAVFYFGIATIVIAILLIVADRRRKP
jgi:hypothetical protein